MLKLPTSTIVNRKIPKNKFYEKLQANRELKDLFAEQVESIVWKHKLSRETIRLEPRDEVEELQIFEITLREQHYSTELLRCIDKAIPYPILHVLLYGNLVKVAVAYKEKHQTDENRAVIRSYYESDWCMREQFDFEVLRGLDLKAVYEHIIRQLLPLAAASNPEIELELVLERQAQVDKLMSECKRLESKMHQEKQFNRKVELNMELQRKRKELAALTTLLRTSSNPEY